jgi:hypothetical protein
MNGFLNKCYFLLLALIAGVSFFFLSPVNSQIFHSDIAVHVLMSYSFRWPQDLYYWGQDRLGSAVPAIGHLLYSCTSLSPVLCASLSKYIFLIAGFLSLSILFKTKSSKLIFALAWFIPLAAFQELVQLAQPYGEQFCFLGLMIFFLERSKRKAERSGSQLVYFSAAIACLFLSIWVSDLNWIAYFLLIAFLVAENKSKPMKAWLPLAAAFAVISAAGFSFIHYAKNVNPKEDDYSDHFFSAAPEIAEVIKIKFSELVQTLLFRCGNILYSWHAVFFCAGLVLLIYFLSSRKPGFRSFMSWRNYFLAYALLCAAALFSSYWVSKNFSANRYFTVLYVSGWIVVLLSAEEAEERRRKLLQRIFLLAALLGAASSIVPQCIFQEQPGRLSRLDGFKSLGRIGVIGDYWRSYYIAAADPENIVATTHEGEKPRCRECTDSVMARPVIYLVRDGWLDSLPQRIWQHGKELERTASPRKIGGLLTAPYRIRKARQ